MEIMLTTTIRTTVFSTRFWRGARVSRLRSRLFIWKSAGVLACRSLELGCLFTSSFAAIYHMVVSISTLSKEDVYSVSRTATNVSIDYFAGQFLSMHPG